MVDWIRENYLKMDIRELTKECNARYGTSLTESQMGSLKKRFQFSGGPRVKHYTDVFPEEVCKYIQGNYKGVGYKEMAERLKDNIGRDYTKAQIKAYYANHGLNSGLTGRFVKGQESHNKGKRMSPDHYEKAKATMFKKGQRPHNAVPVGSTKITEDGYQRTKIAEPNVWEFTHRIIWQQHFGEIPEGMMVGFKDGDRKNLAPENLMLISSQENMEMIRRGLRSEYAEITEVGLTLAKVDIAARRRKKK